MCVVFWKQLEIKQQNREEKEEYRKIWAAIPARIQKVRVMELQNKMRTAKKNKMQAAIPFIPILACVILI